jgi:hypothetical protein
MYEKEFTFNGYFVHKESTLESGKESDEWLVYFNVDTNIYMYFKLDYIISFTK